MFKSLREESAGGISKRPGLPSAKPLSSALEQAWRGMAFAASIWRPSELQRMPPGSCTPWHAAAPSHHHPAKGLLAPTAGCETVPRSSIPAQGSGCSSPPTQGGWGIPRPLPQHHLLFAAQQGPAQAFCGGDPGGGWERHRWQQGASRGCLCPPETQMIFGGAASPPALTTQSRNARRRCPGLSGQAAGPRV